MRLRLPRRPATEPAPADELASPAPGPADASVSSAPAGPTGATVPERSRASVEPPTATVALDQQSVWRAAWVVVAVVALALFARFVLKDGAQVLFTVVMAFFAACAMEPAVSRLATRMPRPVATALVMLGVALLAVAFFLAFGGMLRDQLTSLVTQAPSLVQSAVEQANQRFGLDIDQGSIMDRLNLTSERITALAGQVATGLLGFVTSLLSALLSTFAFLLFTFYLSADSPRLRTWLARLFPPRLQGVVLSMWEIGLVKVGGYVSSRLVLAAINAMAMGLFMWFIDLPYWLPLALWTGLVAQFVPNIGTYVSIVLPVLVGLVSSEPRDGLWVLIYAIAYQQVENVFVEPRISARAVDVHPAVAFASAMMGGALFGASGALLGVPVGATIMALFDLYKRRYEFSEAAEAVAVAAAAGEPVQESVRAELDHYDI